MNIYENHKYKYKVSDEDKQLILDCMNEEFDINYESKETLTRQYYSHSFIYPVYVNAYNSTIWNCSPPLANIKHIVEKLNCNFEDSKLDLLCREIHKRSRNKSKWFSFF